MGGAYCLPKNMMRIINTFGALIVCFEIGLLQSKILNTQSHTHMHAYTRTKSTLGTETENNIYQKSLTDGWGARVP